MFVVVDFEATCDKDNRDFQMEIIEIGAVAFSARKPNRMLTYQAFIKPVINKTLTDFCKDLTSIRQEDVDAADEFFIEIRNFKAWLDFTQTLFFTTPVFCSWGDYDRKQLIKDCVLHKEDYPFDTRHINIKENFIRHARPKRGAGMPHGAAHYGIPMQGTHHRGIDDAIMITKIFQAMLKDGCKPIYTEIQKGTSR